MIAGVSDAPSLRNTLLISSMEHFIGQRVRLKSVQSTQMEEVLTSCQSVCVCVCGSQSLM